MSGGRWSVTIASPPAGQGDMMGTLEMHNVVSVDGYIADEGDHVGRCSVVFQQWRLTWRRRRDDLSGVGGVCPTGVGQHRLDGDRAPPVRYDERLGGRAA